MASRGNHFKPPNPMENDLKNPIPAPVPDILLQQFNIPDNLENDPNMINAMFPPPHQQEPDVLPPQEHEPDVLPPQEHEPDVLLPLQHDSSVSSPQVVHSSPNDPDVLPPPEHEPDVLPPPEHEPDVLPPPEHEPDVLPPPQQDYSVSETELVHSDVLPPPEHEPDVLPPPEHEPDVLSPSQIEPFVLPPPQHEPDSFIPIEHQETTLPSATHVNASQNSLNQMSNQHLDIQKANKDPELAVSMDPNIQDGSLPQNFTSNTSTIKSTSTFRKNNWLQFDSNNNPDLEAEEIEAEAIQLFGNIPPPTTGGRHSAIEWNNRLKLTSLKNGSPAFYDWKISIGEMLNFGFGIGLYFSFISRLLIVFGFIAIISLPILAFRIIFGDTYSLQPSIFAIDTILVTTLGNMVSSLTITENWVIQFVFDVIVAGVMTFFLFHFLRYVETKFEKSKADIPSAGDFTIEVSNPPPNATKPHEYAEYFSQFGVDVLHVTIGFNHGRLTVLASLREKYIDSLYATNKHWNTLEDVEFIPPDCLDPWSDGSSSFLVKLKRKLGILRDTRYWQAKIWHIDQEAHILLKNRFVPQKVYLTFTKRSSALYILKKMRYSRSILVRWFKKCTSCCSRVPKFYGKLLKVGYAPEPSDILWGNLHLKRMERIRLTIWSLLITLLVVSVSFVAILLLSLFPTDSIFIQLIIAFSIVIINKSLILLMRYLGHLERPPSKSQLENAVMIRTFFSQVINTAFLPYIVGNMRALAFSSSTLDNLSFGTFFFSDLSWYKAIAPQILTIIILDALLGNILRLVHPSFRFKHWILAFFSKQQASLNNLLSPPPFVISEYYANALKILYVASFYSSPLPITWIIYAIGFGVSFLSDKYNLLRQCRRPAKLKHAVTKLAVIIACFAPPFKILTSFVFYKAFIDEAAIQDKATVSTPYAFFLPQYFALFLIAAFFLIVSLLFISGDWVSRNCCQCSSSLQSVKLFDISYLEVANIDIYDPPEMPPEALFSSTFATTPGPLNILAAKTLLQEKQKAKQNFYDEANSRDSGVVLANSPQSEAPLDNPIPSTDSLLETSDSITQPTPRRGYHSRLDENQVLHRKSTVFSVIQEGRTSDGRLMRKNTNDSNQTIVGYPKFAFLKVRIIGAMNLTTVNGSKPNPFCVLSFLDCAVEDLSEIKTNSISNTCHPEWVKEKNTKKTKGNTFIFSKLVLFSPQAALRVSVFSKNRLSGRDPLGFVGKILLEDFNLPGCSTTKSFELEALPGQPPSDDTNTFGILKIEIKFEYLKNIEDKPDNPNPKQKPSLNPPARRSSSPLVSIALSNLKQPLVTRSSTPLAVTTTPTASLPLVNPSVTTPTATATTATVTTDVTAVTTPVPPPTATTATVTTTQPPSLPAQHQPPVPPLSSRPK